MSEEDDFNDADPMEELRKDFTHIIDYIVIAKVLNDEGRVEMAAYHTTTLSKWEALGLLEGTKIAWSQIFWDGSSLEE